MPMSQTEIERRLTQQGSDIDAIHDIVARVEQVQQQHSSQLTGLQSDVTGLRSDVTGLRSDVTEILRRLPG